MFDRIIAELAAALAVASGIVWVFVNTYKKLAPIVIPPAKWAWNKALRTSLKDVTDKLDEHVADDQSHMRL